MVQIKAMKDLYVPMKMLMVESEYRRKMRDNSV